ncbi:MAG: MBL fold hydrolase [Idiomarina sp. 34-48-12]|nr:MAG: MBL fold hydrolase [Idiomarina sp. 34-48-12]
MDVVKRIVHHGAHQGVTGSCHEFVMQNDAAMLIDCGQFQGGDIRDLVPEHGFQDIDFPTQHIVGLVLTHCHIDHVGRLPSLMTAGYRAPIYCTPATAVLLPIVLADAMKITRFPQAEKVLRGVQSLLRPLPLNQWHELEQDWRLRLRNAGHIMGSAYVEFEHMTEVNESQLPVRVVFSGDLGCKNTPLLPDPTPLEYADALVLESTYGDRLHEDRQTRQQRLKSVIEKAFLDGGTVLIPAFSIGRTQELLYEIEDIIFDDPKWRKMTVILDSPLAGQYTQQYRRLKMLWDEEAKQRLADDRHPLNFERLHVVESHQQHMQIVDLLRHSGEPAIVLAASGMCSGGRIVNYLKALLGDERTDVVFVGYQAEGTPGRQIQDYGPSSGYVMLDHNRYDIRARIHTLGGYSAHADQRELLEFLHTTVGAVHDVRLVHGEASAKAALSAAILRSGLITGKVV